MEEHELEELVRGGLAERAGSADVHALGVGEVRRAVAQRRRRRWLVSAAAAAVVAVGAATAVVSTDGADDPPPVATEPTDGAAAPGWRTESWGGLTVEVPADWGYGGAPLSFAGDTSACPPAYVSGDWVSGWVGRPVLLSDVCARYPWLENSPQEDDPTPYVWLGGDVEVGTVTWPGGLVQETVEAEGERLTVASTDPDLRARIIASARPVEVCPASSATIPDGSSGMSDEGRGDPIDAVVCAYRLEEGAFRLTYARATTADVVDQAWSAQAEASAVGAPTACSREVRQYVSVQARYDDPFGAQPLVQRAVFRLGCTGEVDLGTDFFDHPNRLRTKLVRDGVVPWAVDPGIASVVSAPTDAQFLAGWLIGMQG
ncbi:hypothetical protein ACFQ0K_01640 [Nocardioides caeni]|uniref:Uncharacterized protein n=1 Tax=Nocardioides caeni TaxID=574700 RepID=A0A4S8NND5_9ACTN|nr:hypothetical protein [Nocardioides caeni]THV18443.1 hypothetical protein E9934_02115 [Nocardioides caeni]